MFTPKKDETTRFNVDYRKLNAVTKRDSYQIMRMNECIESLDEATAFSTLNNNDDYWQIKIKDNEKK